MADFGAAAACLRRSGGLYYNGCWSIALWRSWPGWLPPLHAWLGCH